VAGGLRVTEVWDSQSNFEAWFESYVKPALPEGAPTPSITFDESSVVPSRNMILSVGAPSKPRLTPELAGDLSSSEGTIPDTRVRTGGSDLDPGRTRPAPRRLLSVVVFHLGSHG
jgi:hypothetical protein